jgi:hypothetical protein
MLYYQATALSFIVNPIPSNIMIWTRPDSVFWYNILFIVPSFMFGIFHFKLWNKQSYGLFALRARAASYVAHIFALKDKLLGTTMGWVPTGDNKLTKKNSKVRQMKIFARVWALAPAIASYAGVIYQYDGSINWNFAPFIFLTTFYAIINYSIVFE